MELTDFWGTVNTHFDNGEHGIGTNSPKVKPDTKLISISSVDLNTKANYQDFQRFQVIDVQMAADAEATLPALIEAVKAAIPNERKAAIEKRGEAARKAFAEGRERLKQSAALAWDASPISTARMAMEIWAEIKNLRLVAGVILRIRQHLAQPAVALGEVPSLASEGRAATGSATARRPRWAPRWPIAISDASPSTSRTTAI